MRIRVYNGPNLALLGKREPGIYGTETLAGIEARLAARAASLGVAVECFQSDIEGELMAAMRHQRAPLPAVEFQHFDRAQKLDEAIG